MKKTSRIKIIAPIGELPNSDPELRRRLRKLPKDAKMSDVFRVINEWEPGALERFRQMERTKKSGRLHPVCPLLREKAN